MSSRSIESFIKTHLVEYLPNFKQRKNYMIKSPLGSIAEGLCLEKSYSKPNEVYLWLFVQPLYVPETLLHLTFGNRLVDRNKSQVWNLMKLSESEHAFNEMKLAIDLNIDLFDKLSNPVNFYSYYHESEVKNKNLKIYEAVVYTSIYLSLTSAKLELNNCVQFIQTELDASVPWINEVLNKLVFLKNNFQESGEILRSWEKETSKKIFF